MDPNCWIRESYVLRHPRSRPHGGLAYEPAQNVALEYRCRFGNKKGVSKFEPRSLTTDTEWAAWFQEWDNTPESSRQDGLSILFAGRSKSEGLGAMKLIGMPFSEATFLKVASAFRIPQSVERTAIRNTTPEFTSKVGWDELTRSRTIEYVCRSSASWDNDIMLSVTYVVDKRHTYAVFYGCPPQQRQEIIQRLDAVEVFHPMVLPTLFADIERERQVGYARTVRNRLVTMIWNVPEMPSSAKSTGDIVKMKNLVEYSTSGEALQPWSELRELQNGFQDWQARLDTMIEHFNTTDWGYCQDTRPGAEEINDDATPTNTHLVVFASLGSEDAVSEMRKLGIRIRRRLGDLRIEYSDEIRKCNLTMEVSSLANKIADTRTSISIAMEARADSRKMHVTFISILTMICLSGAFVVGLFSTTFSNWDPNPEENIIRRWIGLYCVIVAVFMALLGCL